jgi:hypothetical protein
MPAVREEIGACNGLLPCDANGSRRSAAQFDLRRDSRERCLEVDGADKHGYHVVA